MHIPPKPMENPVKNAQKTLLLLVTALKIPDEISKAEEIDNNIISELKNIEKIAEITEKNTVKPQILRIVLVEP